MTIQSLFMKVGCHATILWLLVALPAAALGGAESITQRDLFVSGRDGYHTYRIPSLIVTANGSLLAFCEGRKRSASDTGDIDLLVKRSTDGGRTWTSPQVVWDDGPNTCGNPCPVVDLETGTILLLLTHNDGSVHEAQIVRNQTASTRTVWISRSDDDGVSWSPPTNITTSTKDPTWGWYATGPGVGIQVRHGPNRGRLIIPCDHTTLLTNATPPGTVTAGSHIIFSDDHGRTWQVGGRVEPDVNECQVVELADGRGGLVLNMRNYGRSTLRAQARSADGGMSWSAPARHPQLIEPRCQAGFFRYGWPEQGQAGRILFSNPAATSRTNMTLRVSYDDTSTWPVSRVICPGPSAYSCLAVLPGGDIACLYERGQTNPYQKITFARIPLAWLESKENVDRPNE